MKRNREKFAKDLLLRDFGKECIWLFMNVRNKLLAAELRPPELAFLCSARAPAESRAGAGGGGKQRWARASTRRFCFETFSRDGSFFCHTGFHLKEVGEGLEERSGSLTGRNGRIDSKYKEKKYQI